MKNENAIAKRVLNFTDNKIQEITLDDLKSTVKEENLQQEPVMGMHHFDFIENACNIVKSAGLEFSLDPVWAAQNQEKQRPGVTVIERNRAEYGEGDIRSFLMRRIFARIVISTLENNMTSTAVALCYNQEGFQLAFGPHVKICQNLSIMSADKFMTSYSSEHKMPTPQRMLEILGEWIADFEENRKRDLRMIESFQSTIIPHHEVLEIVGDLTARRIRRENSKQFPKEPLIPLNQGQIGKFTESYIITKAKSPENRIFNAWDIYNFATEMYKPGETDVPILLSSNHAMSKYIQERYHLNMN